MSRRIPIIIASKNRPELLRQTVESAIANTALPIHIIIVDDASEDAQTLTWLKMMSNRKNSWKGDKITVVMMPDAKGCGAVKNAGAAIADPGEFIYFSDNDIYFHDDWLEKMIRAFNSDTKLGILGGDRHPHHGIEVDMHGLTYSDQQVGYSMLLRQKVWRKLAPFTHAALGVFGSEDTDLCNKATKNGYRIASLNPRVVTHCGLTNSVGGQAAGYPEYVAQEVPAGVIKL